MLVSSVIKFAINQFIKSQTIKKFLIVAKQINKYTKLPKTILNSNFALRYAKYLPKKILLKELNSLFGKKAVSKKEYLYKSKKELWKDIVNVDNKQKLKLIQKIRNGEAKTLEEKKIKQEKLNNTFWFRVASPETGNFSVLPQYANISKKIYGVPIRSGIFPGYLKYYVFNLGYNTVKQALETENYGKEVYSQIRGEIPARIKILLRDLVYNKK